MKLVSSSTEGVETKNSPESSLTQESEGLVVIGQEFVDERILRDFRRFRREETIEVVRALSHSSRSKGGPHHKRGINTFTWGSIGERFQQ